MLNKPIFIGIAGASSSGKTLLASGLRDLILGDFGDQQIKVINEDCYYRCRDGMTFAERAKVNYDHPDAFEHELLIKHLVELSSGKAIQVPQYNYATHNRSQTLTKIQPAKVILVEGILIFHHPELRKQFDLKIFVDVDLDVCLSRRIKRDVAERGRTTASILQQYRETVRPMHHEFIYPGKKHADLVVPRGGKNPQAICVLHNYIQSILRTTPVETNLPKPNLHGGA